MTNIKKGLFIGVDGEFRVVEIEKRLGLKPYYDLIETDIVERVNLLVKDSHPCFKNGSFGRVFELWVDEEGLFKNPTYNVMASRLFRYDLFGGVVVHGRSLDKLISACKCTGITFTEPEDNETAEIVDYDDFPEPTYSRTSPYSDAARLE